MDLNGCTVTTDQFTAYLLDCEQASYTIDLHNNKIVISLHNACGGVNLIYENGVFNSACVGQLNEFLRMLYATKTVCLNVIPFHSINNDTLSSLSQGLAHEAERITSTFATAELYPRMQAYILEALKNNPICP